MSLVCWKTFVDVMTFALGRSNSSEKNPLTNSMPLASFTVLKIASSVYSSSVVIRVSVTKNSTNCGIFPKPPYATTIGVGGATPSTSGAGITFPATQSASTDANTLV